MNRENNNEENQLQLEAEGREAKQQWATQPTNNNQPGFYLFLVFVSWATGIGESCSMLRGMISEACALALGKELKQANKQNKTKRKPKET